MSYEANGKVLVEEKESTTTVLVSARKFLDRRRELVRSFVAAHAALTGWIRDHPDEARALVRQELEVETP